MQVDFLLNSFGIKLIWIELVVSLVGEPTLK